MWRIYFEYVARVSIYVRGADVDPILKLGPGFLYCKRSHRRIMRSRVKLDPKCQFPMLFVNM